MHARLHAQSTCSDERERDNGKDGEDHTTYFTRSSEADECNNMELLPEGDNQLLCERGFLHSFVLFNPEFKVFLRCSSLYV